jgi:CheY-like chemotaxis protein
MSLNGKHIFIVEDNLQNRIIFQMTLLKAGAQVDFDRWGRDTLHRLQNLSNVDLIILDLMLPGGISGYAIFDQIHALPQYSQVPIVAVSATEPSIGIPMTRQKGFAGFIGKPIDSTLFPHQLEQILRGEPVWYAARSFS